MSFVNTAVWNPNGSNNSNSSTKATWWVNFELATNVQAGLPMDSCDANGNRKAKGQLREFYDFLIEKFQGIPMNEMIPVEVNGRRYILWHGDGTPKSTIDFSGWKCEVLPHD